ncbi:MAG: PRC-barrel domain-containing protein [Leptolyngbyaceae bacterium]|nr:PRC-barrel domain-containing protein [Leptolyngbyaceae bacterium]
MDSSHRYYQPMTNPDQAHPSTLVRQSELLHHTVIDSVTLEELGRVDVLWMFPQVNRVLGIVVKPGWFGAARLVFKLPQIKTIKAQVLVQGTAEDTTVEKVQKLESLIGTEVWTEGGDRLGTITDCLFDLNSGVIIRYLMVPDGQLPKRITQFTDGLYLISPKQIRSFSRQRVLIADESVEQLRLYSEGLRFKLATMTAKLKQDYWDGATEEWRSLSHHVQSIARKATDRMKALAEKAQVLSKTFAQKVSETVADKVDQVEGAIADDDQPWNDPEWVGSVTDTMKTKGQAMVSQFKERSRPMVNRLKTVQQTVKTSVEKQVHTLIVPPAEPPTPAPNNRERTTENTIDQGLDDERLDDERLDDLDWDDDGVDTAIWDEDDAISPRSTASSQASPIADDFMVEPETTPDPWDDWEEEEVDQPRSTPPRPPASDRPRTHSNYSASTMADPWDTQED